MFGKNRNTGTTAAANHAQRVDSLISEAQVLANKLSDSIQALTTSNDGHAATIANAQNAIGNNNVAIAKAQSAIEKLNSLSA